MLHSYIELSTKFHGIFQLFSPAFKLGSPPGTFSAYCEHCCEISLTPLLFTPRDTGTAIANIRRKVHRVFASIRVRNCLGAEDQ